MAGLNRHKVRYLLAGGMAVVAHGYGRMTYDIDLVIRLTPTNVRKAFAALNELGFKPRVPVTPAEFADPKLRSRWAREKNMVVLNFFQSAGDPLTVDLFVAEPFPFAAAYGKHAIVSARSRHALARFDGTCWNLHLEMEVRFSCRLIVADLGDFFPGAHVFRVRPRI